MSQRFLFIVHPLNKAHRRIMGLRARKIGLSISKTHNSTHEILVDCVVIDLEQRSLAKS